MVTQDLTPKELQEARLRGGPVQIVDVRSPEEYAAGHVPGAMNVPLETLDSRRMDLEGGLPLVLVCKAGTRATMARERLADPNACRLIGGTDRWAEEGLPLVGEGHRAWTIERQVRLVVGVLAATGGVLALTVSARWAFVPMLLGLGLTFAGLTDRCGMAILLARMPWNRKGA